MQNRIRILIVDDHSMVRMGMAGLLSMEVDMEVVAEAEDLEQAVAAFTSHRPDVVLMDVRMPGGSGLEALARIRALDPSARVVILSTYDLEEPILAAHAAGACGYLLKSIRFDDLVAAIRLVHGGGNCFPPALRTTSRPARTPSRSLRARSRLWICSAGDFRTRTLARCSIFRKTPPSSTSRPSSRNSRSPTVPRRSPRHSSAGCCRWTDLPETHLIEQLAEPGLLPIIRRRIRTWPRFQTHLGDYDISIFNGTTTVSAVDLGWRSTLDGTNSDLVFIGRQNVNTDAISYEIDNISVSVIPEPGSPAWFGLAGRPCCAAAGSGGLEVTFGFSIPPESLSW